MKRCRYGHGLFYWGEKERVYAFGGAMGTGDRLKAVERMDVEKGRWEGEKEMKVARMNFTPCAYHSLVYLCGGMNPTIETFDLETSTYSLLSLHLPEELPMKFKATTIVSNGKLVVITYSHVWTWNVKEKGEPIVCTKESGTDAWSRCPPVVYGRLMLTLDGKGCVGHDFQTGRVVVRKSSTAN